MKHEESRMQMACVRWFRLQYPQYAKLLFSVPNGGARTLTEGKILKFEGTVAGVSDLILLIGNKEHHSLCLAESAGNKYVIVRSISEFIKSVTSYISNN